MANDNPVGAHVEFQIAGQRCKMVEHFGPASYDSTNKETLQPSWFGMDQIANVIVGNAAVTDSTGAIYGDVRAIKTQKGPYGTWKLIWYSTVTGTEVSNATDLSGRRVVLFVIGN